MFFISYLGLIIPVIGIGIAIRGIGATTAMTWLVAILLLLLAGISVTAHTQKTPRGGRVDFEAGRGQGD